MNTAISKRTQILCVSALMVALAVILSFVKIWKMPFGGSVTLCSIVPIVFVSYRYGIKWGMLSGFAYALLQMLFDLGDLRGLAAGSLIASLFLDYLLAFTILGLGGMFRKAIPNPALAFPAGIAAAGLLRFCCHVISGFILWADAESIAGLLGEGALTTELPFQVVQILYSLIYNGIYMIPDILIAALAGLVLALSARQLFQIQRS